MKDLAPLSNVPSYSEIKNLEAAMRASPAIIKEIPVKHYWGDEIYGREMHMRAGMSLVGKMHAKRHFFVLLSGEITAWTDKGMKRMVAPQVIVTEPGTKRVIAAHTDCRFMTFHGTSQVTEESVLNEIIIEEDDEITFLGKIEEIESMKLLSGA